jgi:hypothetical protein
MGMARIHAKIDRAWCVFDAKMDEGNDQQKPPGPSGEALTPARERILERTSPRKVWPESWPSKSDWSV